ncbi:polyprenyl synthetase family protein [Ammoniphilus resinae]|uniref:Geranylgeranyl diphosphate synthase type II n=1 Tax=Ammoniphilus resinae TaxID=861532 RepID=A0ABS4GV96_9BACL|nr:geranylgeranyl diphosphate synthase type II [Ammoniphilus resinae]
MNRSLDIQQYLQEKLKWIESALPSFITRDNVPDRLLQSMEYSLYAGGKRIRPILILTTMEAFGKDPETGLAAACAVEMIHTYSLIHDDLPAMDDDDFRRGKPTNHKVFDEGTAILAGDGLLTDAFRTLCTLSDKGVAPKTIVQLVSELSYYAGPRGMVGGQMADLQGEGKHLGLPELQYIHQHKTADLLIFCLRAGGLLSGATPEQLEHLTTFGRNVGLAFQIQDDILDIYGDEAKLGKPVGSDEANEKSTYPSLIGLEKSKELLESLVAEAKESLVKADIACDTLNQIADFIIKRES